MRILFCFMLLLSGSSCESKAAKPAGSVSSEQSQSQPRKSYTEEAEGEAISRRAAAEVNANLFVEIEFRQGSAGLTDKGKKSLQDLMQKSLERGKIDDIMILSWADNEYPSGNLKRLSKGQVKLAKERNTSVQQYVKSVADASIEQYNLAKQPGLFARWFNTADARLKNTLVAAGLPTTSDELQYPSKASHSVIIVKLK